MANQKIAEFAKVLLQKVRDKTIESCDNLLDPTANNVISRRWQAKIADGSSSDLATTIIADCVDDTLFHLLHAIDEGLLHLSFVGRDGAVVDLTADGEGELAGAYMASGGWRSQFSKTRFVDDFEDLV